jgi:hypothetical protein
VFIKKKRREYRRRVPVDDWRRRSFHRPRSSSRSRRAKPCSIGNGGGRGRTPGETGSRTPCASREVRRSASGRAFLEGGTRRAIGVPRAVIIHSCPVRTSASSRLRCALASLTPADRRSGLVFIRTSYCDHNSHVNGSCEEAQSVRPPCALLSNAIKDLLCRIQRQKGAFGTWPPIC